CCWRLPTTTWAIPSWRASNWPGPTTIRNRPPRAKPRCSRSPPGSTASNCNNCVGRSRNCSNGLPTSQRAEVLEATCGGAHIPPWEWDHRRYHPRARDPALPLPAEGSALARCWNRLLWLVLLGGLFVWQGWMTLALFGPDDPWQRLCDAQP